MPSVRSMGSSRVGFPVNLPSPAVDELEPEAIVERAMVAMAERGEVDAAAMYGQWRRRSFPSLQCLPLDRIGLGVGNSGGDEPRTLCPWSPPPLYSTAR